ncbi:MAG: (2E,6E)-farnesyl diphosphate synthase [Succinivibrio sp.]|nr:(2E,6E)-farnesyl diphosphate synthase [Succinivibrio sp.]
MSFDEYATWVRERVNAFMQRYLAKLDAEAPALWEAMSYGLTLGGKRVRPLLVYAAGALAGTAPESLDYPAAAVECIHAYSLIHDDMPEMDNDVLRRGQPSVHAKFGPALGLLSGDALQALAFRFLSDPVAGLSAQAVVRLCALLSELSGYAGMCGGQALDLEAEGVPVAYEQLRLIHAKKTGALIRCAVQLGYQSTPQFSPDVAKALDDYARCCGQAFQIWDDVLDVIGSTEVLGKQAGHDEAAGKSTYPALLGLDKAQELARQCVEEALAALHRVPGDTNVLEQFARFTIARDH